MTKGTRLLLMVLVLIAVVIGMTQCMQKSIRKKKNHNVHSGSPQPTSYLENAGVVGYYS